MGNEFLITKDAEGNNHLIFDQSALYDDTKMGNQVSDFEVLRTMTSQTKKNISKVRCLKNNKIYLMEKINLNTITNDEEKKLFFEQMEKLKSFDHPHLIKYYKTFQDDKNCVYIIFEYMDNSDLNSLIKANCILNKAVKEETVWNILLQTLSGLSYLHKENLAFLAIRPTNIFLNNEQNTKIGLFDKPPKSADKNYDFKDDVYFIGKYFYRMCFRISNKNAEFKIEQKENKDYSKELMDIIFKMTEEDKNKRQNSEELYKFVKKEYVNKYSKITSIEALLRCLYAYPNFNKEMQLKSQEIESNKEKFYISYWFLKSINAISQNDNLKECFEEFRRVLASSNSKIDCSREVDPLQLFTFLLEKMHKELNQRKTTIVDNQNVNDKFVINSIYRTEEKDDKTNKIEMWNKFQAYFNDNIKSIISNNFYGARKIKKICQQCKNGFYSYINFFCSAFDLIEINYYGDFNLEEEINKNRFQERKKENAHFMCEICLTEQDVKEYDDYYQMNQHLTVCFYRGENYTNDTSIDFKEFMSVYEMETRDDRQKDLNREIKYQLIGAINRIIRNGNEEFYYFCRDLNNNNLWYTKDGTHNGTPIEIIKNTGQVIMLFYNKISGN